MPSSTATLRRRLAERRVLLAVLAVAAVALALRLVALGYRVIYYDEAWFGYWVLRFLENGTWEYRAILHGPFFARLNSVVFPILGVSDFTARLVVAAVGGLLPLAAWLFREHLRDAEVVALAVALAFNPILLYYSRFMRKDLPLAAFMLVALGLVVRAYDTRRPRYLYGAAVALGIAFATKESVLLWLVTWLGAGVLVLDYHLLSARDRDSDALDTAKSFARRAGAGLRGWTAHGLAAGLVFLAVVVYFYAPRAPPGEGPGLWTALGGQFGQFPAVIGEATLGSLNEALAYWAGGSIQDHAYLPYLKDTLRTLAAGAPAVSALAVLGFLYDRYAGGTPRNLVAFSFYCGVAATVGYPIANNLPVPWSTIHAVVPLTIPAAVGAGVLYRWGRSCLPAHDRDLVAAVGARGLARRHDGGWAALRAGVAAGALVLLVVTAGAAAYQTSYAHPHDSPRGDTGNEIVYYAQAPGELREGAEAIRRAAATGGDDADVLYVGESLAMDESAVDHPPETGAWHARMPLPWYTEAYDADVESVATPTTIGDDPPPVVITTTGDRDAVAGRLGEEYEATHHPLDEIADRDVVFFVREQ